MKFHALFALASFLAFSTLARSHTSVSVSTTSFNYCLTAYGIKSISPVPTVFGGTVTVSNTKTTTSTIAQCTLTIPQLPIFKATKTVYTTLTRMATAPTQTSTATLTQTAGQSTTTASATITVGIDKVAKAKRGDSAVLNHPHGVPAIERRAGFPSRVSCVRQVYIQTFIITTTCKYSPNTDHFTTTTSQTAFSTVTSAPIKTITTTITKVMTPTTRTITATVTQTTVTNTASPSSTANGVCETPPTVADTLNCNPINAKYDDEENDIHREAVYNQFYSGVGFTTDRRCAPASDSPGGSCGFGYWEVVSTYSCTLSACDALQQCANDAVRSEYGSLDLHYLRSTQEWECFAYQYDQRFSDGNTAADFNQANADVVVAYGYQVPAVEPEAPEPSMETGAPETPVETGTPIPSMETGAPETSL